MNKNMYDLIPFAATQKSFYGKAKIMVSEDAVSHIETLYSYNTPIITYLHNYNTDVRTLCRHWDGWSNTTGRHIKEFTYQLKCGDINKAAFNKIPLVNYNEFMEGLQNV